MRCLVDSLDAGYDFFIGCRVLQELLECLVPHQVCYGSAFFEDPVERFAKVV